MSDPGKRMLLKRVGTAPERKLSTDLDEGIPFEVELAPEVGSIDDLFYWTSANGTWSRRSGDESSDRCANSNHGPTKAFHSWTWRLHHASFPRT
jgi:hypothetical protein